MEIRPIETLREWEKNKDLRNVSEEDFERLKHNLSMGQHSNLLIKPDGTVLGGNNRLKAMLELGYKTAKCNIVEFGQDESGFYPIIDGETFKTPEGIIPIHFKTQEQGEIELAYSHNMRAAYDNKDGVANMVGNYPDIDWHKYDASFANPWNILDIAETFKEGDGEEKPERGKGPPAIKIVFANAADRDKAREAIDSFLDEYPGAKYTVSK